MSSVYWIHHTDHTNIFSQGYVGVSNDFERRIRHHKTKPQNAHLANAINKYGWDNLVKKVLLIAEDTYCYDIEAKLRPSDNIGWNLIFGGGKPPVATKGKKMPSHVLEAIIKANTGRKHTPEAIAKISKANVGRKMSDKNKEAIKLSNSKRTASMKGKHFPTIKCTHCDKVGGIIPMKRWHINNCKFKEQSCQV
jgi:group I intron endonuclease